MSRILFFQRISFPVISITTGLLFPLGFAPFEYVAVAPLSIGALFYLWVSVNARTGALLGLCFGLGAFAVGVSWVFISLHNYGNMPTLLAAFVVVVFVSIMALYPTICGLVQGAFHPLPRAVRMLLVMPSLWVVLEWFRGQLFGGFPWLFLGYGQIDTLLGSWAPISGVFSVSLFAAISGAAVILTLVGTSKERIVAIATLMLVFTVGALMDSEQMTVPDGGRIKIAVIQNDVPLADKWDSTKTGEIIEDYLTTSAYETDAHLVVWPEAALPVFFDQLSTIILRQLLEHPPDYLFGVLERQQTQTKNYYNSAVGISDDFVFYRKRQLVMFGEYLPLPFLFSWLLDYLDIPMSNFSSWSNPQLPMQLANHRIGVTICYEDAFQRRVVSALPEATVLVNISEDAWFGDSFAPWQHLQISRMRALEVNRPLIRSSNNGLSALIDHLGQVIAIAPKFQSYVLRGEIQPMRGITPFVRFGNAPLFILLGLVLVACFSVSRIAIKRKRDQQVD